jgi:hypothetical protein
MRDGDYGGGNAKDGLCQEGLQWVLCLDRMTFLKHVRLDVCFDKINVGNFGLARWMYICTPCVHGSRHGSFC